MLAELVRKGSVGGTYLDKTLFRNSYGFNSRPEPKAGVSDQLIPAPSPSFYLLSSTGAALRLRRRRLAG